MVGETQLPRQRDGKTDAALAAPSLFEASIDDLKIEGTQSTLSSQQSPVALNRTGFAKDDHSSHADNSAKGHKSFHIRVLNPFRMVSSTTIRPFLDSFLQHVNHSYYCINAEYLVRQFGLAVGSTTSLSNHVMYTLCLCIGIGCQVHNTGTDEMAIMWYENGRRYLDSDDWGWSLNVMRALALISIFHSRERPTTARHYLGTFEILTMNCLLSIIDAALRIGEANNLSIPFDGISVIEDTPVGEWKLIWQTIQAMATTRHSYRATPSLWI